MFIICPNCGSNMKDFPKEHICQNSECGTIVWNKGPELSIVNAVQKGRSLF